MSDGLKEQDFTESVVGVDIGDRVVTAARVHIRKDGQLVLTHAGAQEYATNATDAQIAHAIRSLWRAAHFSSVTVASCLRSPLLCLKHFRFQGVAEAELASALGIEAEEALQMPQERIALDWHVIRRAAPPRAATDASEIEGLLVATPAADMQRHLAILGMAGLYPVVLDVGPLAVSNLYQALAHAPSDKSGVCLVNLCHRQADMAILYDTHSVYPRTIVSRKADWDAAPDYLVANIQDVLKFYQFKLRQEPLNKILLCGQIPAQPGFVAQLQKSLGMKVEAWNPLRGLKCGFRTSRLAAQGEERMGAALAASIGMALRRD
jgi:Tfp pilus assembly PilM family ATPase